MAVSTEHTKDILIGDGVNTKFPFTFQVLSKEQIQCLKVLPNGEEIEILKTEIDIKLNDGGTNGGEVTYPLIGNPLEEGCKFIIFRQTVIKQDYTPPNGQVFDAVAIKNEIDRLTMQNQEQEESLSRAVKTLISSEISPDSYMDEISRLLANARELNENSVKTCENTLLAVLANAKICEDDAAVVEAALKEVQALAAEFAAVVDNATKEINDLTANSKTTITTHTTLKVEEYNKNHTEKMKIVQGAVVDSLQNALRAEIAANTAEVQAQSIYIERIELETSVIALQERKCRYLRHVAAGDSFSIDLSNVKQLDKDITIELILKMPEVVSFDLSQILPLGEGETADENKRWLNGSSPDFSEPGEYWIVFLTQDGGQSWRASYEGRFII